MSAEELATELGTAGTIAELDAATARAAAWLTARSESDGADTAGAFGIERRELDTPEARLVVDALHTAGHRREELRTAG